LRFVAAFWGALLPIYTFSESISPFVLDVVRVMLLCVLLIRGGRGASTGGVNPILIAVAGLSMLITVSGVADGDRVSMTLGVTMALSACTAWVIAGRPLLWRPVLVGFAFGTLLAAITVVLEARGGDLAGQRVSGFSSSVTRLAYELAAGAVVWWALSRLQRSRALLVFPLLLTGALLICGGRGGVAALALAVAVIGLRVRRVTPLALAAIGGLAWAAPLVAERLGVGLTTVDRFRGASDFTTGRVEGWELGWQVVVDHPLTGIGIADFAARYHTAPHFPPLNYGVAAGGGATLLALFVLWRLVRVIASRPRRQDEWTAVGYGLVTVSLARSVVETNGALVGMEQVTLLVLGVLLAQRGLNDPETMSLGQRSDVASVPLDEVERKTGSGARHGGTVGRVEDTRRWSSGNPSGHVRRAQQGPVP
jgi:hypothetical protein